MSKTLRLSIWILLALVVLAGLAFFAIALWGLPAPRLEGNSGKSTLTGAYGPLTLEFTLPVDPASVETRLRLDPAVEGHFTWDAARRRVSFWPARPLTPGKTYTLRLDTGARSSTGLVLRRVQNWQVEVRQAAVLYLSPSQAPELWQVSADGQNRVQLTQTGGKVFDYSTDQAGARIVYAERNNQQGIDLWEMNAAGSQGKLILPCGTDWCINPIYAPEGSANAGQIIYSRRKYSGMPGSEPGAPQLWRLNLDSGSTDAFGLDINTSASSPAWSPDGRFLAFVDEASGGVRVLDLQAKSNVLLPASVGAAFQWSPDSQKIYYTGAGAAEEQPYISVYVADAQSGKSQILLGENNDETTLDYSVPDLTPDGQWLAVARRPVDGSPAKQLWLQRLDGSQRQSITNDALVNHAAYHWDPSGELLVFQQFSLGQSRSQPQVQVWNRSTNAFTALAEDAFQPHWRP